MSNTAQLPTKTYQVAEAGRVEDIPKSRLQLCQNRGENKIKKSKLVYCLNYKKATKFSHLLQLNTVKSP